MKKGIKFIFAFFLFFAILFISKQNYANSINSISMDIYVDKNGNAQVTEVWSCYASSGTEVYHPYYNLGNSKISNLQVSESGHTYESLSSWQTSGTLDTKSYKCGINTVSNGVELCWGISKYGSHTYTVKYNISNFVANLTDSQMIYWTLIPYDFSNSIGNVYIKVHTDFNIPDTTDVWGYGNYGGTCYVYDGYIEMQSDGALSSSEYMTLLAKFPSGTFNVQNNNLNNDFDYYYEMSKEGSTSYVKEKPTFFTILAGIFAIIFNVIVPFMVFAFIVYVIAKAGKESKLELTPEAKKALKEAPYFRDIPCGKDLYIAYYVASKYNISKKQTSLLGAIILKWLQLGYIKIEKKETGTIFKKENSVIILDSKMLDAVKPLGSSYYETSIAAKEHSLYKMLYEASKDGILENKEFEKWCSSNYKRILNWFDSVSDIVEDHLISENLITEKEEKIFKIFKAHVKCSSDELNQMAIELLGLKKYLNDYTLIKDRESIEVALFEDYLIFAQILGIADKVAKEFKELYPDVIQESNFDSYDYIFFINTCTYNGIHSASIAKSRAENYSSGGGGFSSGGGGGGSFGGGGGGGGFR